MRIPDELQIFNVGDKVKTVAGQAGIVTSVSSCSVYYEHRPIASFTRFHYSVDIDGDIHRLSLDQIIVPQ
jgi:hypothetical protein